MLVCFVNAVRKKLHVVVVVFASIVTKIKEADGAIAVG